MASPPAPRSTFSTFARFSSFSTLAATVMAVALGACAASPETSGASRTGGSSGGLAEQTGGPGAGGPGGGGEGGGGALVDTTTRAYPADDPGIEYLGRVSFTNPKQPRFDLGGVQISARFNGTAVAASLKDEFRYGKYVNSYDAIVDGVTVMKLVPKAGVEKYVIATGLSPGEHRVTLVKRTEAAAGAAWFIGFAFAGDILPAGSPASLHPTRRIEFIGDSITAGSGIEAANGTPPCTGPPDGWGLMVENAYKSYGPLVSEALGADYHLIAVSGIGLLRNYSNMYDARTMPEVYDLYYPELMDSPGKMDQPRWDAARRSEWVPDALVIGLGTNDFGPGDMTDTTQPFPRPALTAEAFSAAYVTFVTTLRGYYPTAHIFLVSSPVLASPLLEAGLQMTEDHFAAAGDLAVHHFVFGKVNGLGCGTHPNAEQHVALAKALAPFMQGKLGW